MCRYHPIQPQMRYVQSGIDTIVINAPYLYDWILPNIRQYLEKGAWKSYTEGERYRADLITLHTEKYSKKHWRITIHGATPYSLMDHKTFKKRINYVLSALNMPRFLKEQILSGAAGKIKRIDIAYDTAGETIVPLSNHDEQQIKNKRLKKYQLKDYWSSTADSETLYFCSGKQQRIIPIAKSSVVHIRYDKSRELLEKYGIIIPQTGRIETRYQTVQTVKRNGMSSIPMIVQMLKAIENERRRISRELNRLFIPINKQKLSNGILYSNTTQSKYLHLERSCDKCSIQYFTVFCSYFISNRIIFFYYIYGFS